MRCYAGTRLKLDDEASEGRFREVLFVLSSVSAKDSFLLHYQEYLSRRLLDTLNEPRTDMEGLALRLLGEQVGTLTINQHLTMVRDIDRSLQSS